MNESFEPTKTNSPENFNSDVSSDENSHIKYREETRSKKSYKLMKNRPKMYFKIII